MRVCGKAERQPSPLLSLPPSYRLPFYFSADFFNLNSFLVENRWLFVSGFVCTCATSPPLDQLWFLRWLRPGVAVTQGLSLQRPEEESSATAAFHQQLCKHTFDVLNFRSNRKNVSFQNHSQMQIKPLGSSVDSHLLQRSSHPAHTPKRFCLCGYLCSMRQQCHFQSRLCNTRNASGCINQSE